MLTQPAGFDTEYPTHLFKEAALAFRDYQFKRYGRLMIVACLINALGLTSAMYFGASRDFTFYAFVFFVAMGPIWLLYKFYISPYTRAAMLRQVFAETGRVTVGSESIALPMRRGEVVFPWNNFSVVLEKQAFFLLAMTPFSFYFVP